MNDVAVITTYFAPSANERMLRNYRKWRSALEFWNVPIFTAELAFGNKPFRIDDATLQLRASHAIWAKENLLNLLVSRLPDRYTKIVWSDCDVLWDDPDWIHEISHILDEQKVAQAFNSVVELGQRGTGTHEPWATASPDRLTDPNHPGNRPGIAWSARRELFEKFGLYDKCVIGSGDTVHTHLGFMGKPARRHLVLKREDGRPNLFTEKLTHDIVAWAAKVNWWVDGEVGCCTKRARRMAHGSGAGRGYNTRYFGLQPDFDPLEHLHYNDDGVIQFNDDREKEIQHVRQYFDSRNEDQSIPV